MSISLLILDLDDSKFGTKSIEYDAIDSVLDSFHLYASNNSKNRITAIIEELLIEPFDLVAIKYKLPSKPKTKLSEYIQNHSFKLDIKTYDDYSYLTDLAVEKILVPTGFHNIEMTKIHSPKLSMTSQLFR